MTCLQVERPAPGAPPRQPSTPAEQASAVPIYAYKCPFCHGALKGKVQTGQVEHRSCGSRFRVCAGAGWRRFWPHLQTHMPHMRGNRADRPGRRPNSSKTFNPSWQNTSPRKMASVTISATVIVRAGGAAKRDVCTDHKLAPKCSSRLHHNERARQ